jgi:hypothetical protein
MLAHRRQAALVLMLIALVAIALFALGITLCIDWGGASSPPPAMSRPAALVLSVL